MLAFLEKPGQGLGYSLARARVNFEFGSVHTNLILVASE